MSNLVRALLLSLLLLVLTGSVTAQKNWKYITSIEDVCQNYPAVISGMFDQINLDYKGLEKVKAAYENGEMAEACNFLLEYYRNGKMAQHGRMTPPEKTGNTVADADSILKYVFVIQNVRGVVPVGEDGHRNWYYKGPNNDEEWAWLSNRHDQVRSVLSAYGETGNPKYAEFIDQFLRDFIIRSMPYPAVKSRTSIWRGLEVAARAKVWTKIFYSLLYSEYLTPATQILMLSSFPDHAHYNRNFHAGNNWLTMGISALATLATNFPEYKNAEEWLSYSIDVMAESMKGQVYPDGVQTELTSHYHNVSLMNFELFQNICQNAERELPEFFNRTIEGMYSYIAHAMRPDGSRILNNDGDRGSDRNLILRGAEKYDNREWEFIATNGKSGVRPADGPSFFFPWAGQLVSRSGFDSRAQWSFFDIGPWGSGHQHNDKLNIAISAYGRDFLVDAGRFAYTGEVARKFRKYASGSAGHNLILIDGKGQGPGPLLASEPLDDSFCKITAEYDFATQSFDTFHNMEGTAKHSRSLFYVRGSFWVVVDRITTDRPRKIDALWHWHPGCSVVNEKTTVRTDHKKGNLTVIPVGNHQFDITFIKGQEEPEIQGWYSPEYNVYTPNVTSIYSTRIDKDATFVWVIMPSEKKKPGVTARILEEDNAKVTLEVTSRKNSWTMEIPFGNNKEANLVKN